MEFFKASGMLNPPWWALVLITLGLTHVTIVAVTLYLHRHQAHRAVDLHPAASHFFRCWLWLTTGMETRAWVDIHRKHHASTETASDPHSPQIHGIRKVLLEGAELYRSESRNPECLRRFGHSTPDDWLERHLYAAHPELGLGIMLGIDLLLFGPIGLTVWAVQMLWIPFFAAGVINGVGHYRGYRNFAPDDASTNILPWGILIGGEELHNNHHAYISSARFSSRRWEFDLGWFYIRLLACCRLATVRRVAPAVYQGSNRSRCDETNLKAVILHRHHVLAQFGHDLLPTVDAVVARELSPQRHAPRLNAARRWLRRDGRPFSAGESDALAEAIGASPVFAAIHAHRESLAALWSRSSATSAQLAQQLEDWCHRAEESGVAGLAEFAGTVRRYDLPPLDAT